MIFSSAASVAGSKNGTCWCSKDLGGQCLASSKHFKCFFHLCRSSVCGPNDTFYLHLVLLMNSSDAFVSHLSFIT